MSCPCKQNFLHSSEVGGWKWVPQGQAPPEDPPCLSSYCSCGPCVSWLEALHLQDSSS
ncbi:serpin family B member 6 [Homo sapiens]|uniref:Serpin family B member 6 n=1 Tax=Homo sapiens TaxID=9606 RepID=A0A3B3ISC3_HUMAN|nr:serpin family B member 6 [Homo sapiens]KAI4016642.1 serpin family B member 6 [Homo sapiens]